MKIDGRLFLVLVIAMAIIPEGSADSLSGGISVSSTGGNAEGLTIAINEGVAAQIDFVSSDIVDEYKWLDDATGKHVEEKLNVIQGTGSYNSQFLNGVTPVEPNQIVPASLYLSANSMLSVTSAKEIHQRAEARNGEKDVAFVFADLWDGATSGYSSNSLDAAIDVTNGVYVDASSATASQSVAGAVGGKIRLGSEGNNVEGDGAGASTEIHNGNIHSWSSNPIAYTDSVYSTISSITAQQNLAEYATGDGVGFYGGAYDKNGNSLQYQVATGKGMLAKGTLQGYRNSASATSTQLSGNQHADVVEGNWYTQDCGLSYSTRDSAGSFGWGSGFITNYNGVSESALTKKYTSASADSFSGNMALGTNSYANFDQPENHHASVNLNIVDGVLKGYSNEAKAVTSLENPTLMGSQKIFSASGNFIRSYTHSNTDKLESFADVTVKSSGSLNSYSDFTETASNTAETLAEAQSIKTNDNIKITQGYSEWDPISTVYMVSRIGSEVTQGSFEGFSSYSGNLRNANLYQKIEAIKGETAHFDGESEINLPRYSHCSIDADIVKVKSTNYEGSVTTKKDDATVFQTFGKISGDKISIEEVSDTNYAHIQSKTNTEITDGIIKKLTGEAILNEERNSASTYQFINGRGSLIDVTSRAHDVDLGSINGMAEFGVLSKGNLESSIKSKASPEYFVDGEAKSGISLDVSLPKNIPRAIILEPDKYLPNLETVAGDLKEAGYATERYTNSAASKDLFTTLDDFQIAIVSAHMAPGAIFLTHGDFITDEWLDGYYINPPGKSFVLLSGCDSFNNYPSPLALAISEAQLKGGFAEAVNVGWSHYLVTQLISLMADGMTAEEANKILSSEENMAKYIEEHKGVDPDSVIELILKGKDFRL